MYSKFRFPVVIGKKKKISDYSGTQSAIQFDSCKTIVLFFKSRLKYEISANSLQLRVNRADRNNRKGLELMSTFWIRVLTPDINMELSGPC